MKVLCIKDGENTFGTECTPVKKGQIYNVTSMNVVPSHFKHQGIWYELEEMPNYTHWCGLFITLSEDDKLGNENDFMQVPSVFMRLKTYLKLQESLN